MAILSEDQMANTKMPSGLKPTHFPSASETQITSEQRVAFVILGIVCIVALVILFAIAPVVYQNCLYLCDKILNFKNRKSQKT